MLYASSAAMFPVYKRKNTVVPQFETSSFKKSPWMDPQNTKYIIYYKTQLVLGNVLLKNFDSIYKFPGY